MGAVMRVTLRARVQRVKRRNNSTYGNPSWNVLLADENGTTYWLHTDQDAQIGYTVGEWMEGKSFFVTIEARPSSSHDALVAVV